MANVLLRIFNKTMKINETYILTNIRAISSAVAIEFNDYAFPVITIDPAGYLFDFEEVEGRSILEKAWKLKITYAPYQIKVALGLD